MHIPRHVRFLKRIDKRSKLNSITDSLAPNLVPGTKYMLNAHRCDFPPMNISPNITDPLTTPTPQSNPITLLKGLCMSENLMARGEPPPTCRNRRSALEMPSHPKRFIWLCREHASSLRCEVVTSVVSYICTSNLFRYCHFMQCDNS